MLSPKHKRYFVKIIPFGIIWTAFGLLYAVLEYGIMGDAQFYPSTSNPYSLESSLISITTGCFLMGLILGSAEVLFLNALLKHKSFWQKIVIKTALYFLAILILLIGLSFIMSSIALDLPLFHPDVVQSMVQFTTHFVFTSILIYTVMISMVSLFVSEVTDYIGGSIFNNFFTGKYYRPRQEDRIFMFLDMKSSTTIAERLGHVEYFKLLNKYYADTTEAIIETSGQVYQYAGDEVIVTWKLAQGLNSLQCIKCFFLIKEAFRIKADSYVDMFGLVPEFKAGLHCGQVTTGEIGELKKEIFFTGDVLNTTARIQASCNALDADILISEELKLQLPESDHFTFTTAGERELRGRQKKANLYSVASSTHLL